MLAAVAATTVLVLAGCSLDPAPAGPAATGAASGTRVAPEAARGIAALLDRRAAAVRRGDAAAYGRGVGGSRARQDRWFDNVVQLPASTVGFSLEPASLVRDGDGWWGTVRVELRLRGYDAMPVVTRDRYRFVRDGRRFRVTSMTDAAWERRNRVQPQPWDLERVVVRERAGVLGMFDAGSADRADELVSAVADAVATIGPRLPIAWDGRVVVYALSDPAFVSGLEGVPGGDPLAVDGLAFPVVAGPDGAGASEVASTRVVLNPRILSVPEASRDRLLRHELVHVALGERDDRIPVWLSEGLAEYLSVQTLPTSERLVPAEALTAARRGLSALPDGETFNGPASQANYGVAWWVCEAVAETWGEQMLWTLVEELDGVADPVRRLEQLLGVDEQRLLDDAARMMLATYS
ncbi:hypothetical protein GCM10009623_37130 [Nocardioides aestuarii]